MTAKPRAPFHNLSAAATSRQRRPVYEPAATRATKAFLRKRFSLGQCATHPSGILRRRSPSSQCRSRAQRELQLPTSGLDSQREQLQKRNIELRPRKGADSFIEAILFNMTNHADDLERLVVPTRAVCVTCASGA